MVKTTLWLAALACCAASALAIVRVDQQRGFRLCNGPQHAQLVKVEADGPGCNRWPCLIPPGREGAFKITLFNPEVSPIHRLTTDIHGMVRLKGAGRQKIGMPGEVKKKACGVTNHGCPVGPQSYFEITKVIKVPMQARMISSRGGSTMMTEFKVRDGRGRVLTCFKAPVRL